MTDESFDVIVVGARVAGATVASLLGDAGRRVLLLDKAMFPSDTLSTHFFRGGGLVGVLASLGVLDFADRFAASTKDGFHGSHPEESWVRMPYGAGWALIGDAGLHPDPWTGPGMDFAGVAATYLAEALNDVLSGGDEADAMTRFHERRDAYTIPGFRTTTTIGRDLRVMLEELA